MSAAGFRRGGSASLNEAEGQGQLGASPTSKLAENMERTNLDENMEDGEVPYMEDGEVPYLEDEEVPNLNELPRNYELKAHVDAAAEAQAKADAEADFQLHNIMQRMTPEELNAFARSFLSKCSPDVAQTVPVALLVQAQAQTGYSFQVPPASSGKRKAMAPQDTRRVLPQVKQAAVKSRRDVEAEIRALEIEHGCDLSEKTMASERIKAATNEGSIPRLIVELQIALQRNVEYESKKAVWAEVTSLRTLGHQSNNIDRTLNAPRPKAPRTPQEKALAKLRKAQDHARANGVLC